MIKQETLYSMYITLYINGLKNFADFILKHTVSRTTKVTNTPLKFFGLQRTIVWRLAFSLSLKQFKLANINIVIK
mgnify:CR=1 FL=1